MTREEISPALSALIQATAGAGGGAFSTVSLFPLDLVKTRIQAGRTRSSNVLKATKEIYEQEGVKGLINGIGTKTSEATLKNFAYFYVYEHLVKLHKGRGHKLNAKTTMVLGYIAGVVNMVCTMPLEVLGTRLQTSTASFADILKATLERDGISGLYTGFNFNMLLCLNPAIVNTVFDTCKAILRKRGHKMTAIDGFLLGAFAKSVATVLTYPLVRLKTKAQTNLDNCGRVSEYYDYLYNPDEGFKSCTPRRLRVWFLYWFRGLNSALMKTCLQAALMYMAKDQIAEVTRKLIDAAQHFIRENGKRHKIFAVGGRPIH